jgi:cation:H+ antiporter
MGILIQFILLIVGFTLLARGADCFVDGAAGIAGKFGIPQLVIGLTIVAMGTSAPEAAVSITAALRNSAEITIGNVVGSNILNVLIILGITSVITAVAVAKSTVKYEMPYMIFITLLLLVFGYTGGQVTFIEGVLLWVCFIIYLAYLFRMAKNNKEEADDGVKEKSMFKLCVLTVIGLVCIILGSDVTVDAATEIAKAVGLSKRFIALTVVALGTSLPELFTSVSAAMKGKADIAIGNIVGSNVFNILFVVGTTALITPVLFELKFVVDTLIAAGAGLLLWLCVFKKQQLKRTHGIIMLGCYAAYFMYLIH